MNDVKIGFIVLFALGVINLGLGWLGTDIVEVFMAMFVGAVLIAFIMLIAKIFGALALGAWGMM